MDPNSGAIVEVESAEDARNRGLVPLPNRRARRAMGRLTPDERVAFCAGLTPEQVEAKLSRAEAKRRRRAIRAAGGKAGV